MSAILSEHYKDLAAELGDAHLKRKKLYKQIKEFDSQISTLENQILSLDDAVPLIKSIVMEGKQEEAVAWKKRLEAPPLPVANPGFPPEDLE